jgi:hypothetical protein
MIIDVHYKKATIPGRFFLDNTSSSRLQNIFVGGWALTVPGKENTQNFAMLDAMPTENYDVVVGKNAQHHVMSW